MAIADVSTLNTPVVWAGVGVFVLLYIWQTVTAKSKVPPSLPWVGKQGDGLFSEVKATFASFNNVRKWLGEGYNEYSQKGRSYIFPDFSGKPELVIPNASLRWLLEHDDKEVSVGAAHYDLLNGDYAFTDPYVLKSLFHEHVIHKNLARRLAELMPGTWDELGASFDDSWGHDTENWKEIVPFHDLMHTISRVSNRMFVGKPLCRNTDYLSAMKDFATAVMSAMMILRFTPAFLVPVVGPLAGIPNKLAFRRARKPLLPIIQSRLQLFHQHQTTTSETEKASLPPLPEDYITWHIRVALEEDRPPIDLDPTTIARFLLPVNFAAIHTTTFTLTNLIFDLVGSDPQLGYIPALREEAERVYRESNGTWTKSSLAKMVRADSATRESMRVSGFMTRGVQRKVVAESGLRNEEEGWTAPKGSLVSLDVWSRHHDPEFYPNPEEFDAFRFSRGREAYEAGVASGEIQPDQKEYLRLQNQCLISTGEAFLNWGHGVHACPGRFFINQEIKLALAHILLKYELEPLPNGRPPSRWFGGNVVPPMEAKIRVRKRKDAVTLG
ncbi:hypothetical protein MBLNU230_g2633t2 [Neophaeotheca triangularis]